MGNPFIVDTCILVPRNPGLMKNTKHPNGFVDRCPARRSHSAEYNADSTGHSLIGRLVSEGIERVSIYS